MPTCPVCGAEGVPILYGFPNPAAFEKQAAGQAVLGGCLVWENRPNWACTGPVQHRWFEEHGDAPSRPAEPGNAPPADR